MDNPRNPAEKIPVPIENQNRLWLDRARVFQTVMREMTSDYAACGGYGYCRFGTGKPNIKSAASR